MKDAALLRVNFTKHSNKLPDGYSLSGSFAYNMTVLIFEIISFYFRNRKNRKISQIIEKRY